MAPMAVELVSVWAAAPFTAASRYCCRLRNRPLSSTILASQLSHDKKKLYKDSDMFSLRKKIEDAALHAAMLAPTALELEEARCLEQEEMIREHNLWDDLTKSNEILVKLADSIKVVEALKDLAHKAEEAKLITELAEIEAINYGLFMEAYAASLDVSKFLNKYESSKLLIGPYDKEGACLIIEAGSDGTYPEIWAEQLMNMYMRWAEKQGYTGRAVEICRSKNGGIKYATIEFESKYAYGYLSGERGLHSMIRSSRYQSTLCEESLAAVDVIPLFLEAAPDLLIDEMDLMISIPLSHGHERDLMGPLVCIQHSPTGLRVQSSGERSCFANKMKALNRLKAKLLTILMDHGISDVVNIKKDVIVDIWNQEARRYVFHPNKLVQDVKTGIELPDLNSVLNGNIQPFIAANIKNVRQACHMV